MGPASHGFRLSARASRIEYSPAELEEFTDPTPAKSSFFFLELTRGGEKVEYFLKGTLSGGKVEARLGSLGGVDLKFVPHRVTTEPVYKGCHGQRTLVEHGAFEGLLDFRGEHGYTSFRRRRIPATLTRRRQLKCFLTPTEGKGPRGVRVEGSARTGKSFVGFVATRTSAAGAGSFLAYLDERRAGMSIARSVAVRGPAGSLEIEKDLSAATVKPPAPFRGSADFVAETGKQTGSLRGSLAVAFPGRPGAVRLAGRRVEGTVLKVEQCSVDPGVICFGLERRGR